MVQKNIANVTQTLPPKSQMLDPEAQIRDNATPTPEAPRQKLVVLLGSPFIGVLSSKNVNINAKMHTHTAKDNARSTQDSANPIHIMRITLIEQWAN